MNVFKFIGGIFEFLLNLFGVNTQHNPNRETFIQKLDVEESFEKGLELASNYHETFRGDPAPRSLIDVFRPDMTGRNFDYHMIYKIMDKNEDGIKDPDSCLSFVLSKKAILLPDIISEYLQMNYSMYTYEPIYTYAFRDIQYGIYAVFLGYFSMYALYQFMSFCLFINPYRYPYVLLTTLCEPFTLLLEAVFPSVVGISLGYLVGDAILLAPIKFITDLSLTMPFLPSEATIRTVGDQSFYVFSGTPELWRQYGIPENLRTDWFDRNNIGIIKYYSSIYKYADVLPSDLARIRQLGLKTDIDPETIKRAFDRCIEGLKASGLTKAELQNAIDIAKRTIAKDELLIKYKYR